MTTMSTRWNGFGGALLLAAMLAMGAGACVMERAEDEVSDVGTSAAHLSYSVGSDWCPTPKQLGFYDNILTPPGWHTKACFGTCGAECNNSQCTPGVHTHTYQIPEGTVTCVYDTMMGCGSHAGCRKHDQCLEDPPDGNANYCHEECVFRYGIEWCSLWALGYGPFDAYLSYAQWKSATLTPNDNGGGSGSGLSVDVGFCAGICGGYSQEGGCYCDELCTDYGDCCSDACSTCGHC